MQKSLSILCKEHGIDRGSLGRHPMSSQQLLTLKEWSDEHTFTPSGLIDEMKKGEREEYWYILEALITAGGREDISFVMDYTVGALKVPDGKWDLAKKDTHREYAYYRRLRVLVAVLTASVDDEVAFGHAIAVIPDIMEAISLHIHPELPWTSKLNSSLVEEIAEIQRIQGLFENSMDQFLRCSFFPTFSLYKNINSVKLTSAGYFKKGNHLKSKLNINSVENSFGEDEHRSNWKENSSVKSLSSIWFIIYVSKNLKWLDSNWAVVTSSILKIFDDPDVQYKEQACKLLSAFLDILDTRGMGILIKTGLLKVFVESCITCFSFLPSFTPPDVSLKLMKSAYPVYFSLSKEQDFLEVTDVLNITIRSISHISGDQTATGLLSFILSQICGFVDVLGPKMLISMSKINTLICSILTDPFIVDVDLAPVQSCLDVQKRILELFLSTDSLAALEIIFSYRFDMIGATCILLKRKPVPTIVNSATSNIQLLTTIARKSGQLELFQNELGETSKERPDMEPYFKFETDF